MARIHMVLYQNLQLQTLYLQSKPNGEPSITHDSVDYNYYSGLVPHYRFKVVTSNFRWCLGQFFYNIFYTFSISNSSVVSIVVVIFFTLVTLLVVLVLQYFFTVVILLVVLVLQYSFTVVILLVLPILVLGVGHFELL